MFVRQSSWNKYVFCFLEKELPKSCNYHFIFVRQKLVGALDVSLGALGFGGGRFFFSFFFLSLGTAVLFEPLTARLVDFDQ